MATFIRPLPTRITTLDFPLTHTRVACTNRTVIRNYKAPITARSLFSFTLISETFRYTSVSERRRDTPNMSREDVKEHITSSDTNWGTSRLQSSALSKGVSQFNFVAHENTSNVGDTFEGKQLPPTNHWSLFLTISPDSSVQVEVAPNEPGEPGMVLAENKASDFTTKNTKRVSINVPNGVTVADVFNVIIQKKRDYYIFAPVGEGCRFWLYTLANDFSDAKLISSVDAHKVKSALGMYWPYPTGTSPVVRPMTKGEFPKSEN